jgi:hypothetical protein
VVFECRDIRYTRPSVIEPIPYVLQSHGFSDNRRIARDPGHSVTSGLLRFIQRPKFQFAGQIWLSVSLLRGGANAYCRELSDSPPVFSTTIVSECEGRAIIKVEVLLSS